MISDIVRIEDGKDIEIAQSDVGRAGNVINVQLGSLEYAPNFGVDLRFFLVSEYEFQNQSFQSYLINRLVESQVNVIQCLEVVQNFFNTYRFLIGDPTTVTEGLIR